MSEVGGYSQMISQRRLMHMKTYGPSYVEEKSSDVGRTSQLLLTFPVLWQISQESFGKMLSKSDILLFLPWSGFELYIYQTLHHAN